VPVVLDGAAHTGADTEPALPREGNRIGRMPAGLRSRDAKLVPQDTDDEPTTALRERIAGGECQEVLLDGVPGGHDERVSFSGKSAGLIRAESRRTSEAGNGGDDHEFEMHPGPRRDVPFSRSDDRSLPCQKSFKVSSTGKRSNYRPIRVSRTA